MGIKLLLRQVLNKALWRLLAIKKLDCLILKIMARSRLRLCLEKTCAETL
jgi:hypothetical protein